jgi:hypothetical protein
VTDERIYDERAEELQTGSGWSVNGEFSLQMSAMSDTYTHITHR